MALVSVRSSRFGPAGHVDVDRVLLRPGRVVLGDVEGVEVVPVGLDLGPLDDAVPHSDEHLDNLALDDRQAGGGSRAGVPAGKGDVDAVALEHVAVRSPAWKSSAGRRARIGARLAPRWPCGRPRGVRPLQLAERALDPPNVDLRPMTDVWARSRSSSVPAPANSCRPRSSSASRVRRASEASMGRASVATVRR